MKKIVLLIALIVCCCVVTVSSAQTDSLPARKNSPAFYDVTVSAHLPVGVFSRSHIGGMGAGFVWNKRMTDPSPFGFTAGADVQYFLGEKSDVAGHSFRFRNYLYAQLFGGLRFYPTREISTDITAGPAIALYNGSADLGFAARLSAAHYIQPVWSIGPSVELRKFKNTDALWTVSIRASYTICKRL